MELSLSQKQQKRALVHAYGEFWSNTAFKRGWAKPLFRFEDVVEMLEDAAEYVVLLRTRLDEGRELQLVRTPQAGSAIEYLWTVEYSPIDERERFIQSVVHATFSDSNGYVEGLTEDEINEFMKECKEQKKKKQDELKGHLHDQWQNADAMIKEILGQTHYFSHHTEAKKVRKIVDTITVLTSQLNKLVSPIHEEANKHPTIVSNQKEEVPEVKVSKELEKDMVVEEVNLLRQLDTLTRERDIRDQQERLDRIEKEKKQKFEQQVKEDPIGEQQVKEDPIGEQQVKEVPIGEQQPMNVDQDSTGLLEIQKVAHDVEELKSEIHHLSEVTEKLDIQRLIQDPNQGMHEIEFLEKKYLQFTDSLLKDLSRLDAIAGSQTTRPLRKQQVTEVQELMRDVDHIGERLHSALMQLKKQDGAKNEKPEQPKEEIHSLVEEAKKSMDEQSSIKTEGKSLNWKNMKLHPKFEVIEHPGHISLAAFVPGMKEEDILVQYSAANRTLIVKGSREPNLEELQVLRRQLEAMKDDPKASLNTNQLVSLMRLSAGRYGSFVQPFLIPQDIDIENMKASYIGGILLIVLPKKATVLPQKEIPSEEPEDFLADKDVWWLPANEQM